MRVRLKQPAVEARQWDGDLLRFSEWMKAHVVLNVHIERERRDQTRLRVVDGRFTFSLAEGDWLVANDKAHLAKVLKGEFDTKYQRAGLHEPVSGWTPMVQAQHEITVMIPGMLLEMGEENWEEFCKWLIFFANDTASDPDKHAYSIG